MKKLGKRQGGVKFTHLKGAARKVYRVLSAFVGYYRFLGNFFYFL
jgi:hypothetical protein